jgi:hypothetical protein
MSFSPSLPTVLGTFGLNEMPSSPMEHDDGTKSSVTRRYNGTRAQAYGGKPTIGDTYSDLAGDMLVVGITVEPKGDAGVLTVELETPYATTYEVEWVEIDEELIKNPRYWCAAAGDPSDGVKVLIIQDRAMLQKWEDEQDVSYKLAYQFSVPPSAQATAGIGTATPTSTVSGGPYAGYQVFTLSTNAQDYAKKRIRGEEAYRVWAPVLRETSETLDAPAASKCGVVETPPSDAIDVYPDGYVWQRSAYRVVRTGPYGKYRLQREWQGALVIDTDLYPTS